MIEKYICINERCPFQDLGSETGCCADLSTWEDCQEAEFEEEEENEDRKSVV